MENIPPATKVFLTAAHLGQLNLLKQFALTLDPLHGDGVASVIENTRDGDGKRAVHFAASGGSVQVLKYLIEELKLEIDVQDGSGKTPLSHAAVEGRLAAVEYLLEMGANSEILDDSDCTPVHYASMNGHKDVVSLLLSKGINVDGSNDFVSPLQYVATSGDHDTVKILLDHGANIQMENQKQLPPDEHRCSLTDGKGWRCTNFRMNHGAAADDDTVLKTNRCEKHYKYFADYKKNKNRSGEGEGEGAGPDLEKQQLPPDEDRCCETNRKGIKIYRCKNFRMGYGAAADDDTVPKTKRCEKHYNYFTEYFKNLKKKKKTIRDHDDDTSDIEGGSADVGTKRKKKEMEKNKLPPDERYCVITGGGGWKCKNFRMGHGTAADDANVPKTKFCEKHYHYHAEKRLLKNKSSGNGDTIVAGGSSKIGPKRKHVERTQGSGEPKSLTKTLVETKRRKIVSEGHRFVAETSNQPATDDNCDSDTIVEGGSANNGRKRKYAERVSGVLESLAGTNTELHGTLVEVETRKTTSTDENEQPLADATDHWKKLLSCLQSNENEKSTRGWGESRISNMDSLEHYKTKCFEFSVELEKKELELVKKKVELENMSVELEKKKVECTKLHGKLVEVETRKTTATDETEQTPADATECWKKLLSYLESLVQSKVNENSTMGRVESHISDLESLVLRMKSKDSATAGCVDSHISGLESLVFGSENESSILRCGEMPNSERVESEVSGLRLQNEITQSCGHPTDEISRSKLNAEASTGRRKDSHVYECKAKEKVLNVCDIGANEHHDTESEFPKFSAMNISSTTLRLSSEGQNVEEGKDWGSSSKKPSQHGSSTQDHLEMSTEPFANLVSDDVGESLGKSEDFDSSVNSENSLGDPMDMLAMKNRNKNKDEIKWKTETDMLSSLGDDPELCLKAICALYRQEISEDKISPKRFFFDDDMLRCTTLAKFLMDKDCKGDANKSVKELEMFDSKAVEDCKKLVRRYSVYLFDIYESVKDPFFLPATTASHGDQTSK